jgi:hypothetical protein
VKVSRESHRRAKKKSVGQKKGDSPIFKSEVVAKIGRQINHRWPNLGRRLASLIRVSREKVDDLYTSAARTISEHKESFDDRRAERRAQARVETRATQQQATSGRPHRRAVREGTVKDSADPLPSKRTRSSPKSRS